MDNFIYCLAGAHAVYYVVTGVWPIVNLRSFMAVTGPKTDQWLVKTVGLLVTAVGVTIAAAAWRDAITLEIAILALASAASLTAIDVVYVAKGVIAKIYLLDAVPEVLLIAGWVWVLM